MNKKIEKMIRKLTLIELAREIIDEKYDTPEQIRGHIYSKIGELEKELDNE